jgi:hypothetical protein
VLSSGIAGTMSANGSGLELWSLRLLSNMTTCSMPALRPISWLKAAEKEFLTFPPEVQIDMLTALGVAARGGKADTAKPFKGVGSSRRNPRAASKRRKWMWTGSRSGSND